MMTMHQAKISQAQTTLRTIQIRQLIRKVQTIRKVLLLVEKQLKHQRALRVTHPAQQI